jgi:beta-galactosidase/beta-glucuronidase
VTPADDGSQCIDPFPEDVSPRPQLVRARWIRLDGEWEFAFGAAGDEYASVVFDRAVIVPFPPESIASGIGDRGPHHTVWYRRRFGPPELAAAGHGSQGDRVMLRFGAVDYACDVWLDGQHLGHHEGGQTPFRFDVTELVGAGDGEHTITVRAVDDPHDIEQPRGKQDWRPEQHAIWYHRTTGIWQTVWLEAVPELHLVDLRWTARPSEALVELEARLSGRPPGPTDVSVRLRLGGLQLGEVSSAVAGNSVRVVIPVPALEGLEREELLWSPEAPRLVAADVTVRVGREVADRVGSYLGLRSVGIAADGFLLNDHPYYLRSVLEQGYWPDSHLAAPSGDALRREVELIKAIGFNAARVHQKAEDPRFLYWADRLGLLVWGETASAYAFSATAVRRMTTEWIDIVERDYSHPCIVTWVPLNESWGAVHAAHQSRQRSYIRGLAELTRALDPTRPVVSNDGWEHAGSDIVTIHDYAVTGEELRRSYGDAASVARTVQGFGPSGRRVLLDAGSPAGPIMLTEFGGISLRPDDDRRAWGYSVASDPAELGARLADLFAAVHAAPLAGFCYTQLTDTGLETNGLLTEDRTPKLPLETLRVIVTGDDPARV